MALLVNNRFFRGYDEACVRRFRLKESFGPPLAPSGANMAQLAAFVCSAQPSAFGQEGRIRPMLAKISGLLPGKQEDREVRAMMLERISEISSMYPAPGEALGGFLSTYGMLSCASRRKDGRVSDNVHVLRFLVRLRGLARLWELAAQQHDGSVSSFRLPLPCNYAEAAAPQYRAVPGGPHLSRKTCAADLVLHGDSYISDLVNFAFHGSRSASAKADFAYCISSADGYLREMGNGKAERMGMLRQVAGMCRLHASPHTIAAKFDRTYAFISELVQMSESGCRFRVEDGREPALKEFLATAGMFMSEEGLREMLLRSGDSAGPAESIPFLSHSDLEVLKQGYGMRRPTSVFDMM